MSNLDQTLAPEIVINKEDYLQVNNSYCQTIYLMGYPASLDCNWLINLTKTEQAHTDISMFIQPLDSLKVIEKLKRKAAKDEVRLIHDEEKGYLQDVGMRVRLEDSLELIQLLQSNITRPFQVSLIITVWADDLTILKNRVEQIERAVVAGQTRKAILRHQEGFQTQLPILKNKFIDKFSAKNIHTQGLAQLFPLIYDDTNDQADRIVLSEPDSPKTLKTAKTLPKKSNKTKTKPPKA